MNDVAAILGYALSGRAMARFRTLEDLEVAGRTVLVRLDLNVPMKDGEVTDATRIERSVPTVKELLDKGAKVVVLAHFGRPKGKREPSMSLAPLAEPLGRRSAARGGVRRGLHRRAGAAGGPRAAARRGRAAREPALPRRRGEERSGVRRAAREPRRPLRRRRVLGGASGARLDHRPRRAPAGRGRAG